MRKIFVYLMTMICHMFCIICIKVILKQMKMHFLIINKVRLWNIYVSVRIVNMLAVFLAVVLFFCLCDFKGS